MVKNLPVKAGNTIHVGSIPVLWIHLLPDRRCREIFWRRKWQPTPVFLPVKFYGQRSLAGCSPWSHKELDKTECKCTHTHRTNTLDMGLLLLLSHFSRVQLCVTPEMAAHQAPPSLGFSRQEHWSGLPFPSPMHESEK